MRLQFVIADLSQMVTKANETTGMRQITGKHVFVRQRMRNEPAGSGLLLKLSTA